MFVLVVCCFMDCEACFDCLGGWDVVGFGVILLGGGFGFGTCVAFLVVLFLVLLIVVLVVWFGVLVLIVGFVAFSFVCCWCGLG